MFRTIVEYSDKKMNVRTKIKVAKSLKKTKSNMDKGINSVLSPEQQETYAAYKEAKKAERKG